ncbi:hypothetical protein MMC21_001222 [Puttea exsequens]|nr:hypothetical protein [Puttea exsequens]
MAFHQPTFALVPRTTAWQEPVQAATPTSTSSQQKNVDESQEWILFPAAQAASTTLTQTASTDRTPRTAGRSRLSDFGSLAARSGLEGAYAITEGSIDEDGEFDSLDEGLHAFQEPTTPQGGGYFDLSGSILPRHDGLGTFPASSPPMQEQLWHFEQYNPRKRTISGHTRRRSSVQRRLDAVEANDATALDGERRERIEKWRMEQSRVFLDEVEKETRRRRRASALNQRLDRPPSAAGLERIIKESVAEQTEEQGTSHPAEAASKPLENDESLWQRITRRVIRDFIGLDDASMSVIFGESLPEERPVSARTAFGSSKSIRLDPSLHPPAPAPWEERLLKRLARELGNLFDQLNEPPIPFSTPSNPQTDYAGIPITVPTSSRTQKNPTHPPLTPSSFNFSPTLQDHPLRTPTSPATESAHAALWGIEEEEEEATNQHLDHNSHAYWEQPPNLRTVFRLLHDRFTTDRGHPSATTPAKPSSTLNIATTNTPDSLRRAAIIRQYHPLVSAWDSHQRHGHGHAPQRRHSFLMRGRSGSSCASSAVGSVRRAGVRGTNSLASSSRNYWDIGGSGLGSGGAGSAIGVGGGGGGVGAWGEV